MIYIFIYSYYYFIMRHLYNVNRRDIMRKGILFVLSSPSGGGKTTLSEMLIKEISGLECSVSLTTRSPRPGEINGVHYHFVSKEEFLKHLENNEFLESATVFEHHYGTLEERVVESLEKGTDILLTIDVQGAMQIKEKLPAVLIFIIPPSFEVLRTRLENRNTDQTGVIQQRLAEAQREISYIPKYNYVVINDCIEHAFELLCSIIYAQRCKTNLNREFITEFQANNVTRQHD